MLKIRLQRVGKKHEPVFRVVVCDSKRGPKSGDNLEILGSYDPREKNETKIDGERAKHWISNGAQVSDTVNNLLINLGIIDGKKINVLPKKSPIIDEEKIKAEKEAEEAKKAAEEAPTEEVVEEAKEEVPAVEETPAEEKVDEVPVTEEASEEKKEA